MINVAFLQNTHTLTHPYTFHLKFIIQFSFAKKKMKKSADRYFILHEQHSINVHIIHTHTHKREFTA